MMNFPHMIPYNAPYYFVLLIAALLPMILTLAIKGDTLALVSNARDIGLSIYQFWWRILATRSRSDCICYLSDVTNVGLCGLSKNKNAGWVFYLAVFLAILPLVWVKVSPS